MIVHVMVTVPAGPSVDSPLLQVTREGTLFFLGMRRIFLRQSSSSFFSDLTAAVFSRVFERWIWSSFVIMIVYVCRLLAKTLREES